MAWKIAQKLRYTFYFFLFLNLCFIIVLPFQASSPFFFPWPPDLPSYVANQQVIRLFYLFISLSLCLSYLLQVGNIIFFPLYLIHLFFHMLNKNCCWFDRGLDLYLFHAILLYFKPRILLLPTFLRFNVYSCISLAIQSVWSRKRLVSTLCYSNRYSFHLFPISNPSIISSISISLYKYFLR